MAPAVKPKPASAFTAQTRSQNALAGLSFIIPSRIQDDSTRPHAYGPSSDEGESDQVSPTLPVCVSRQSPCALMRLCFLKPLNPATQISNPSAYQRNSLLQLTLRPKLTDDPYPLTSYCLTSRPSAFCTFKRQARHPTFLADSSLSHALQSSYYPRLTSCPVDDSGC